MLEQARQAAQRSVNQVMVQSYWQVGRLIVEDEQAGRDRAAYGAQVLQTLGQRLTKEFGRGFSVANLRNFRQFFQTFTWDEIHYTPCSELSWSHFRLLMRVADPAARQWYAAEAASQGWSVAALDRQGRSIVTASEHSTVIRSSFILRLPPMDSPPAPHVGVQGGKSRADGR